MDSTIKTLCNVIEDQRALIKTLNYPPPIFRQQSFIAGENLLIEGHMYKISQKLGAVEFEIIGIGSASAARSNT